MFIMIHNADMTKNYLGQVCNIRLYSDDLHLMVDMDS